MTSLSPLRLGAFRWLLLGRTVTSLGTAVAPIALGFAVLDVTGSLAALGLIVVVRSVANLAVLLLGGVIADRWPRHLVLGGAQVLAGIAQGVAAVLVVSGTASTTTLVGLGIVNGAAAGLGFPATSALVPQTVPPPLLRQANALNRIGVNTALASGAAAGGLIVAVAGPGWGLAVDAASFVVAAGCFARVRVVTPSGAVGASLFADLAEGWTEFRSRTWVVVSGHGKVPVGGHGTAGWWP